jgi:hypothetical protein
MPAECQNQDRFDSVHNWHQSQHFIDVPHVIRQARCDCGICRLQFSQLFEKALVKRVIRPASSRFHFAFRHTWRGLSVCRRGTPCGLVAGEASVPKSRDAARRSARATALQASFSFRGKWVFILPGTAIYLRTGSTQTQRFNSAVQFTTTFIGRLLACSTGVGIRKRPSLPTSYQTLPFGKLTGKRLFGAPVEKLLPAFPAP